MIVVDCSVVVDALAAPDAEMLSEVLAVSRLMAPHLIDVEMVSAVRGLVLGRRVSPHRAMDVLADYERLHLTRWKSAHDLRRRAFDLRDTISAYDAAYVVLAESLECPLLTRDRRLASAAEYLVDVKVV